VVAVVAVEVEDAAQGDSAAASEAEATDEPVAGERTPARRAKAKPAGDQAQKGERSASKGADEGQEPKAARKRAPAHTGAS
jgi:hypothetical protein